MFQFTHPGRGATIPRRPKLLIRDVSIHAPREGCDYREVVVIISQSYVSIHAPREGCDCSIVIVIVRVSSFNSRTPGGVRLFGVGCSLTAIPSFNSRTPGGVRRTSRNFLTLTNTFQFTHPGRGATDGQFLPSDLTDVSIHAPREGCDSVVQSCVLWGG